MSTNPWGDRDVNPGATRFITTEPAVAGTDDHIDLDLFFEHQIHNLDQPTA